LGPRNRGSHPCGLPSISYSAARSGTYISMDRHLA
jgi:hypothetical protein